jgi:protein-S-isoprenylcysteine O-methyltransferase Ste14
LRAPPLTTVIIAIWVASEIVLAIVRRSGTKAADSLDRSSLRVLWIAIMASVTAGILAADLGRGVFGGRGTPWPAFGLALIVAGLVVRWWAILSLKQAFTVDVAIAADQRLVDHGLYRLIRHPSYTGSLLSFAGFGLVLGNWVSLAAVVIPTTAAFLYRIGVEERALRAGFGEPYARYMQRTRRLIPFLY